MRFSYLSTHKQGNDQCSDFTNQITEMSHKVSEFGAAPKFLV